jgi:heterotetrameric sarcosine oxidase gamma subunit
VAELIPLSPCAGLLPLTIGGDTLAETALGPVALVAPFKGQEAAAGRILTATLGLAFPEPNHVSQSSTARMVWCGPGRALLIGAPVPQGLPDVAAVVDQSDAFAVVRLSGPGGVAVLARLVPLDLRATAFPEGRTARSLLGHMAVSVTRVAADVIEVMAMRSMAVTLVHEVRQAMEGVAARREG